MGEFSQSYGILMNTNADGLNYKDFIPECLDKGGMLTKPTYESFPNLITRANEWLKSNTHFEVQTCESVEFAANRDTVDPLKMNYYENARYETWYIRGLRLWLKPFPSGNGRIQIIGYMNLVPAVKEASSLLKEPVYEDLDEVLLKFNNGSRAPGRIITIETQGMKIKDGFVDPDRSRWTERGGRSSTNYTYVIRIFYEVCDALYEEIGLTDFVPEIESTGCMDICAKYEEFSKVVEKASNWCAVQSHLRVCNIQSVDMKYVNGVNTKKMNYTESGRFRNIFVKVLRIAHTCRKNDDNILPVRFTCKSFIPVVLKSVEVLSPRCHSIPEPKFETLEQTMQKASAWIQTTGANVISMETSAIAIYYKGVDHSSERTLSSDPLDDFEHYMFVIRAYLNGSYTEPAEDKTKKIPVMSFRPFKAIALLIFLFVVVTFIINSKFSSLFRSSEDFDMWHNETLY